MELDKVNTAGDAALQFSGELLDTLPQLIWVTETDGTTAYVNKSWSVWSSLSREQMNSGEWIHLFHPDDLYMLQPIGTSSISNVSTFTAECRLKSSNGTFTWFSFTTTKKIFDVTQGWCVVRTFTNIDHQKKVESELKESERQFRQLADVMPQQVWTANEKGELDYVNNVTIEYFGRSEDEIVGNGWESVVHPDDLPDVLRTWQASLRQLQPYQVEFRLKNHDGVYRWHLARATCFVRDNNQVRWYGTNTDIESHKLNEKQKDDFISMASHELKTPVTSIKGYAQILQNRFQKEGNEMAADLLKRMDTQVDKLNKLVGDFLNLSKIESQHFKLEREIFNFRDLVEDCILSAQHTSTTHQFVIEKIEDVQFNGDKLRLEQVLNNFLNNAVKYSPEADKVVVRVEVLMNNIVVSIRDFGIGIERENLNRIFDRFYRVDNTSMKFQGLGLGLYISSEIIKAHKGSFWIESEVGKGSTFFFLLPLNPDEQVKDLRTDYETFYFDPQVKIKYDPENHWLAVDWIGFQNLESVQRGCMIMLDLLKKNKVSKVLNDNTNVLGNWSEASDWGGTFWFPEMQKAGLEFFAWIYSPSTFSKLAAHKSLDVMAGTITTQFFTTVDEAADWLKRK
jgi:PAS domain S-box-containing protein